MSFRWTEIAAKFLLAVAGLAFAGTSGYELSETRSETVQIEALTQEITGLQKEMHNIEVNMAKESHEAHSPLDVFSGMCVCVSKSRQKVQQTQFCRASGDICDEESRKICGDMYKNFNC